MRLACIKPKVVAPVPLRPARRQKGKMVAKDFLASHFAVGLCEVSASHYAAHERQALAQLSWCVVLRAGRVSIVVHLTVAFAISRDVEAKVEPGEALVK